MKVDHSVWWQASILAAHTAIIVVVLLVGLRIGGKRRLGQASIYDLALIMAVANAVQNAMTQGRGELWVGFVTAGTLLLIGKLCAVLFVRLPALETRVVGTPTIILQHGELLHDRMRREHITEDQVLLALRQHGLFSPRQAELGVLEVDGSLAIVPRRKPRADEAPASAAPEA